MKALSLNMREALELAQSRSWGGINSAGFHAGTLKALERRGLLELRQTTRHVEYTRNGSRHHWTRYYKLTEAGWNT